MNIRFRTVFKIDEGMIKSCIAWLLTIGEKPTKKLVLKYCREALHAYGERFEVEPIFDDPFFDNRVGKYAELSSESKELYEELERETDEVFQKLFKTNLNA